jgi:long-chain acyl-CoA synthetase
MKSTQNDLPIYQNLINTVKTKPQHTAISFNGEDVSYRQLLNNVTEVATGFQDYFRKNKHKNNEQPLDKPSIGLFLPNSVDYISLVYGAFMSGNILVPINVMLTARELVYIFDNSNLSLLFTTKDKLAVINEALIHTKSKPEIILLDEIDEDAGGVLYTHFTDFTQSGELLNPAPLTKDSHVLTIYTSGTTGHPKGVMISNGNLQAQVNMIKVYFEPVSGDKVLCMLPLFQSYALNCLLNVVVSTGVNLVLYPRFEVNDCINALTHQGITMFAGVPTMYGLIVQELGQKNVRFKKLKYALSGGAPLHQGIKKDFEDKFKLRIYEGYGLSEATVSVSTNHPGENGYKNNSVGKPYLGIKIKILDYFGKEVSAGQIGEFYFKGANVMLGYLKEPEATSHVMKNGWLASGDMGLIDEQGFIQIVDRKKDIVIKAGYNIFPREVEEVICNMAEVAEVCVEGIPDRLKGQCLKASIVLKEKSLLTIEDIKTHLRTQLARYKWPNEYVFCDSLAKNAIGKTLKNAIQ